MLHDAAGLGVKPSPRKATNKAENILAAEHVMSNFWELGNEWGYYAILTPYFTYFTLLLNLLAIYHYRL